MKRDAYLTEFWSKNPYPTASGKGLSLGTLGPEPANASTFWFHGRLLAMGPTLLRLSVSGSEKVFKVKELLELEKGYQAADCLAPGDWIEISGIKHGAEFEILKINLMVPTKGQNPFSKCKFNMSRALDWQKFVKLFRDYFIDHGFVELRTPYLVPSPGLEPHLDPFETQFVQGKARAHFFLPTSPEFHLKKALTLGFDKCFELKECFRNGERGGHHEPEFLMLEWYRSFEDNSTLIRDLKNIFARIQKTFPHKGILEVKALTMEQLWKETLNFSLTPSTTRDDLAAFAKHLGADFSESAIASDDFDDLFHRIFLAKIEPVLAKRDEPLVVWHFPPSQAALARLTKDGWADRFELYWRGLEIANAFHELNDVAEQRKRFIADQKKKQELRKPVVPIDDEFMAALEWGMPPAAGIALGMERLFMALMGISEIGDVRLFPMTVE